MVTHLCVVVADPEVFGRSTGAEYGCVLRGNAAPKPKLTNKTKQCEQ